MQTEHRKALSLYSVQDARQTCSDFEPFSPSLLYVPADHQLVRLVGGSDRCAGRVELWKQGRWGTVCDDQWDLRAGHVVCAQLHCGYALEVTGQDGPFPQGSGPIFLDEVNCTGAEGNLWECPAVKESHDCGHKEDAGVVCSEMRAVRLTGGADRCSGKVEIHRNGTWGTVCDNCWSKQEASMVCSMLGCGEVQQYKQFDVPFTHHNNLSLWYYVCKPAHKNLWECEEKVNNKILCHESNAAGLICIGSLGFAVLATTPDTSLITTWTTALPNDTTTDGPNESWVHRLSSLPPETFGCIALSFVLLIALIVNFVLCHKYRRRNALIIQPKHVSLQMSTVHKANDYRDPVDHVKATTGAVAGSDDSFDSCSSTSGECYENLVCMETPGMMQCQSPVYNNTSDTTPGFSNAQLHPASHLMNCQDSEDDYDDVGEC